MTNLTLSGTTISYVNTTSSESFVPNVPAVTDPQIIFSGQNVYVGLGPFTQHIYLACIQEMGGSTWDPILVTDGPLWVKKDIECYGALMTTTDPANLGQGWGGGGAILFGHGFRDQPIRSSLH